MKKKIFFCVFGIFVTISLFVVKLTASAASYDSIPTLIRSHEEKIIQDDPYTPEVCDTINLMYHYGIRSSEIMSQNHQTISLKISFDGKEQDDGYQEILIFNSFYEENVGKALDKKTDIELTPGKIQKEYSTVTVYLTIDLSKVENDMIYIRWGAHGSGYDDWYCKNVKVYFETI